jgi:hypothetical protein
LEDLTYYGIDFDPDDVIVETDPFLMGRTVLATKERLAGFHKRIIEGDLPKQLNAAVVAHSIMTDYTQTPNLSLKWEPEGEVYEVFVESREDEDFWRFCNGFLKDFGLSAKLGSSHFEDRVGRVYLELEFLSE